MVSLGEAAALQSSGCLADKFDEVVSPSLAETNVVQGLARSLDWTMICIYACRDVATE